MSSLHSDIQALIKPVIESSDFIYWGLEIIAGGKHPVIRVFIDSEKGVDVDDCGNISREIGATLEVADKPSGEYVLEVSSPGIDRLLFRLEQYSRYIGHTLGVTLITAVEGRRRYKAELLAVNEDVLTLGGEDHQIDVLFIRLGKQG